MRRIGSTMACVASLAIAGLVRAGGGSVESLGVGVEPLRFGTSTVLSGPSAALGTDMVTGINAAFARQNALGGIGGRPLELIALDDGYEPVRTAPNMRTLLEQHDVLAVVGNVGTPTAIAAVPIAVAERTLLFAPFTGAGVVRRDPPQRYVVNFRASYAQEIAAMVDALIDRAGVGPESIALLTQRDGYGDSGHAATMKALRRRGLPEDAVVAHGRYDRNTVDVEAALADLLLFERPPRAIIVVGTYAPTARFIQLARDAQLNAAFLCVSFTGADALSERLDPAERGVVVTQVVPDPSQLDLPLVRDFRADLARVDPAARPSFVALEGYTAGLTLLRALHDAGPTIDREALVDAFERLGTFDVGAGVPLELSPTRHQASDQVWPTRFDGERFVAMDWAELADVLEAAESPP